MTQPARSATMITADEFLLLDTPEGKVELVRGEVRVMPPASNRHSVVVTNVLFLLESYVRPHRLGRAFADGMGYELVQLPNTVRVPDVSFVRAERLPIGGFSGGLMKFGPDLAVEVLSPGERPKELQEKLDDLYAGGTRLIWIIDPRRRTVKILEDGVLARTLREDDALDGGTVIPGFSCAIAELFEGIARG